MVYRSLYDKIFPGICIFSALFRRMIITMKRWIILDLAIFILMAVLSLTFAPDVFSLVVIFAMFVLIGIAFSKGMWMVLNLADGFRTATRYIYTVKDVASDSQWNTFRQSELIFHNRLLDRLWQEYDVRVNEERKEKLITTDIEYVINEETLALYSWRTVVLQIPGTLTALGLIGTFIGLILGISGIAFSSVDAAISSITMLLSGIETAFYTSIIGVILSMVFNISYKLTWNTMLREMGIFMTEFHKYILPEQENQQKQQARDDTARILECLERIPKGSDYFAGGLAADMLPVDESGEKALMTEIWEALKNDDFTFFIQPRIDLNTKEILSGEALMRWNHRRLGIVSPTVFLPSLEKNGFIVQLDRRMWENVCSTLRSWLDRNLRPVPISVNISKMDLLSMDAAEYLSDLVHRYQIPPQYVQLEIAENAYVHSFEAAHQTESRLRQEGFRVIINSARGEFDTLTLLMDSNADALKIEAGILESKQADDPGAIEEIVEKSRRARVDLIASGIENVRQVTLLRKAGITDGQGFFLKKPVDVKTFEEMLAERT